MLETNINNDFEDSEKSLSLGDNHICIPHLFENYLNAEKSDNKDIVDDKNNLKNNKEKDSQKLGVESFESKTTIIEKRNKFGRKRKEENKDINNNKLHDKFSDDNVRRKLKRLIFSYLRKYINNQIKIKYNGKIGKGIYKKELYTLNQEQIANANVTYNKLLLKKTLFEIFSVNISGRITNFSKEHNKIIINELINEKDKEKRIFF